MTADSSGGSAQTAAQQATQQIANLAGDTFQQAGSTMEQSGSGQSGRLPADWQSRLLPGENPLTGRMRLLKAQKSSAFGGYTSLPGEATATTGDAAGFINSNSLDGINNQSLITSDMSVPTEGMAQDNLGIEAAQTVGGVPITGGFTPQNQTAAEGIYGDQRARQTSFKKPLIKLT
jgi:hypothetical protein